MIGLAVATGWTLEALEQLDERDLATFVDVVGERARGRRHG